MNSQNLTVIFEQAARQHAKFYTTSLHPLLPKEQTFLHYHDVLELGVCLEGAGELLTETERIPYTVGDVQLILPYQPHYNVSFEETTLWMFMNIDVPRISSPHLMPDPAYLMELTRRITAGGIFTAQSGGSAHGLITDIAALMRSDTDNENADLLTAKLITLLLDLSRNDTQENSAWDNAKKHQSVLPAMHVVSKALQHGQRPTPCQMADACFMSESYFRKIFSAVMGESPKNYITRMQTQKAARLLATTNITIAEIAALCGFAEHSTLYRCFMRLYGMPPGAYRDKGFLPFRPQT